MKTGIRQTLQKMEESSLKKILVRNTSIWIIRKMSDDLKKWLNQEENKGLQHNLNYKVSVITKRLKELYVLQEELVHTTENADKIV